MDVIDVLMVGVIIVILGVGSYLLYLNWPGGEEMQYEDYQAKFSHTNALRYFENADKGSKN